MFDLWRAIWSIFIYINWVSWVLPFDVIFLFVIHFKYEFSVKSIVSKDFLPFYQLSLHLVVFFFFLWRSFIILRNLFFDYWQYFLCNQSPFWRTFANDDGLKGFSYIFLYHLQCLRFYIKVFDPPEVYFHKIWETQILFDKSTFFSMFNSVSWRCCHFSKIYFCHLCHHCVAGIWDPDSALLLFMSVLLAELW